MKNNFVLSILGLFPILAYTIPNILYLFSIIQNSGLLSSCLSAFVISFVQIGLLFIIISYIVIFLLSFSLNAQKKEDRLFIYTRWILWSKVNSFIYGSLLVVLVNMEPSQCSTLIDEIIVKMVFWLILSAVVGIVSYFAIGNENKPINQNGILFHSRWYLVSIFLFVMSILVYQYFLQITLN